MTDAFRNLPAMDLESVLEQVQDIAKDVVAANALRVDQEAAWPEPGLYARCSGPASAD